MQKLRHLFQKIVMGSMTVSTYEKIRSIFKRRRTHKKDAYSIINLVITLLVLLSFWAIISIELSLIPLIPTNLSLVTCEKINKVLLNLSYSYFAGFIMYELTVTLPVFLRRRKLKPVLETFIHDYYFHMHDLYFQSYYYFNFILDDAKNDIFLKSLHKEMLWSHAHSHGKVEPLSDRLTKLKAFYEKKEALISLLIPHAKDLTDYQLNLTLEIQVIKIDSFTSPLKEPIIEPVFYCFYFAALRTMLLVKELTRTIPERSQKKQKQKPIKPDK